MLENALSALYLLKGWMDCNQTCTDISGKYKRKTLVTLILFSRSKEVKKIEITLVCTQSPEEINGCNQTPTDIALGDAKELFRFW